MDNDEFLKHIRRLEKDISTLSGITHANACALSCLLSVVGRDPAVCRVFGDSFEYIIAAHLNSNPDQAFVDAFQRQIEHLKQALLGSPD